MSGVSLNNIQTSIFNRPKKIKTKRAISVSQFTVDWFESRDVSVSSAALEQEIPTTLPSVLFGFSTRSDKQRA